MAMSLSATLVSFVYYLVFVAGDIYDNEVENHVQFVDKSEQQKTTIYWKSGIFPFGPHFKDKAIYEGYPSQCHCLHIGSGTYSGYFESGHAYFYNNRSSHPGSQHRTLEDAKLLYCTSISKYFADVNFTYYDVKNCMHINYYKVTGFMVNMTNIQSIREQKRMRESDLRFNGYMSFKTICANQLPQIFNQHGYWCKMKVKLQEYLDKLRDIFVKFIDHFKVCRLNWQIERALNSCCYLTIGPEEEKHCDPNDIVHHCLKKVETQAEFAVANMRKLQKQFIDIRVNTIRDIQDDVLTCDNQFNNCIKKILQKRASQCFSYD